MALARAQKKKEELEKKKKLLSGEEVNLKFLRSGDATNYPLKGDSVSVHYRGYLSDGTKFDDSYERGQPLFFVVGAGQVIPGWDMIMPLLSLRSIAQIECPPELAYGMKGYPPIIPPLSTLRYEIELVHFTTAGNAERLHRERKILLDG